MNKKIIVPVMLTLTGVLILSGCGNSDTKDDIVEDMSGTDVVKTKSMEKIDDTVSTTTVDENATTNKTIETTTPKEAKNATTIVTTNKDSVQREAVEVIPAEDFSKEEQTTGSKKHDDFILEHVKHNDQGDKYAVVFRLDRKHDAKTHEAPFTVATYHVHDTKHNHGRIEVEIHEINKNTFDSGKVIEPKHNKYVKDIVMEDSGHESRALFVIHLDEKATGKFNLSSNVENNQNATITLDVLE